MATKKSQRIGIWIIAGIMLLGTVGGFIAMMVGPANEAKDQAALAAAQQDYSEKMTERQNKVDAQGKKLSKKYYDEFAGYASRVAKFDSASVDKLQTKDLKEGTGEKISPSTNFSAYYIGWNPKGEVFDQSIEGVNLKAPYQIDGLELAGVIDGWKEGLVGMKIGGVRELTIPADKAYGEQGSGDKIPANTPLKFIVMAIKTNQIAEPEMPEILKKEYERLYGSGL